MSKITIDDLNEAALPGGPSIVSEISELAPAGGASSLVSPARYLAGSAATYVYSERFVDGVAKKTVLLDSRSSVANRIEDSLLQAIDEGHPVLSKMPRIVVSYDTPRGAIKESDIQLPHRAFDAHIRLGSIDGISITKYEPYISARNSSERDAWNLFSLSPITVLLGGWDSTRRSHQVRFASAVVGEIIGVLADQEIVPEKLAMKRSGARIDPVAAKIIFSPNDAHEIASRLGDDLSAKKKKKLMSAKTDVGGSDFVIGAIPPSTDALDGIATSSIIRSYVLSFSALRRLHFGKGSEGDAAIRALLSAIAINGIVRNDSELYLRANAFLVEKDEPKVLLDRRMGKSSEYGPLTVEEADALLVEAFAQAQEKADLDWHGQILDVAGDPAVIAGAADNDEE